MTRKEKAMELHKTGCNCAQAVALAFADKINFDENQIFAMTEGFGAGGGNFKGTCGALSAAYMVNGILTSTGNCQEPTSKRDTYNGNKELAERFTELVGAQNCFDIKGIATKKVLCSCNDCVGYGAQALAEKLGE